MKFSSSSSGGTEERKKLGIAITDAQDDPKAVHTMNFGRWNEVINDQNTWMRASIHAPNSSLEYNEDQTTRTPQSLAAGRGRRWLLFPVRQETEHTPSPSREEYGTIATSEDNTTSLTTRVCGMQKSSQDGCRFSNHSTQIWIILRSKIEMRGRLGDLYSHAYGSAISACCYDMYVVGSGGRVRRQVH
ncbi:hypothetical protein BDY19DRAFT_1051356 [Irpex rosettiformis]|uniref:Uncharacterized protein n=1 Tax=Irpex rosettiformis TaxID=378272 RepID=A0ACB8TQQ4_9APHY|nr:hypothetical protein BDY19DRAFT_1051356 [Irpex rosettiformis]